MPRLGAVFSDIDGTLVHYQVKLEGKLGYRYLGPASPKRVHELSGTEIHVFRHEASGLDIDVVPVPSATLGGGFCSVKTLELAAKLREHGVKFVLITGARTKTFRSRVASKTIPAADYNVCEGGGRIWNVNDEHDDAWTDRFAPVCGPWRDQLELDCVDKKGPLWDVYRTLAREDALGPGTGRVKLDGKSFVTAFMADVRADSSVPVAMGMDTVSDRELKLRELTARVFEPEFNTSMVVNLGKAHLAPVGLDKKTVVEYIASKEGISLTANGHVPTGDETIAAALFDDENDLGFAGICSMGFAPSVAHPSVMTAMETMGPAFERVPCEGLLGTEYALEKLLAMVAA